MAGSGGASRALVGLVLIAILLGGGAYNYHRNTKEEEKVPRPYRGYSDTDLDVLGEALEEEIELYAKQYEAATGHQLTIAEGGLLSEQVSQFEKVQRISAATRDLGHRLTDREASLKQIRRERSFREEERDKMLLILRRAFAF